MKRIAKIFAYHLNVSGLAVCDLEGYLVLTLRQMG
jgi:hypothetical protein